MNKHIEQKNSFNSMRVILMYDLPNVTTDENKFYSIFRKAILKLGYIQLQYSIYSRVIQSKTLSEQHIAKLKKILPPKGNIRIFVLTEYQYQRCMVLSGEVNENEVINDERRYRKL